MALKLGRLSSDYQVVLQGSTIPTATVSPLATTTVPAGWLLCDGSAVSRITYATLFATIGVTHGSGNGSTTFNLPDYRGRFLRGVDGTANRDVDKASRAAMAAGGATGNNVGSVQTDALQGHNHRIYFFANQGVNPGNADDLTSNAFFNASQDFAVREAITDGVHGTPRISSETRPTNANVAFIIKA